MFTDQLDAFDDNRQRDRMAFVRNLGGQNLQQAGYRVVVNDAWQTFRCEVPLSSPTPAIFTSFRHVRGPCAPEKGRASAGRVTGVFTPSG